MMRRRQGDGRGGGGGDDVDEEDEEGSGNAEINFARRIMRFTAQSRGVIVLIMMSMMWKLPEPNIGKTQQYSYLVGVYYTTRPLQSLC